MPRCTHAGRTAALLALLCLAASARAQVFNLHAGASTLYDARGAELTMHAQSLNVAVGAGTLGGRFTLGTQITKQTAHARYMLGSFYLPFDLPTDIFNPGHTLSVVGAGMDRRSTATQTLTFLGAMSSTAASPLFQGSSAQQAAAILCMKRQFTPHWALFSNAVESKQLTILEGLEWTPTHDTQLAATAGMAGMDSYKAISFVLVRPRFDLKAAYVAASAHFQRVQTTTVQISEAIGGNAQLTLRPTHYLSFTTGHQSFLTPASDTQLSTKGTMNDAGANLTLFKTNLTATVFTSSYLSQSSDALALTAARDLTPKIHLHESYLASRSQSEPTIATLVSSLSEDLTAHWTLTEFLTQTSTAHATQQTNLSFGGGYLSNLFTLTADYQTYYLPTDPQNPFKQALMLDVTVHPWHNLTLHGATFVDPLGRLRYTIDSDILGLRNIQQQPQEQTLGESTIHGRVMTIYGEPVMGAALLFEQLHIYTDSDGRFLLRERKPHTHQMVVLVDQFLNGDYYTVVSAPYNVKSSTNGGEPEITIILKRMEIHGVGS